MAGKMRKQNGIHQSDQFLFTPRKNILPSRLWAHEVHLFYRFKAQHVERLKETLHRHRFKILTKNNCNTYNNWTKDRFGSFCNQSATGFSNSLPKLCWSDWGLNNSLLESLLRFLFFSTIYFDYFLLFSDTGIVEWGREQWPSGNDCASLSSGQRSNPSFLHTWECVWT